MFDIGALKVGDEVGFARYYNSTLMNYGFSNIVKINKFGHIMLENGTSYDKHGTERKSPYSATYLYKPETLRERLQERNEMNEVRSKWSDFSKVVTLYLEQNDYSARWLSDEEHATLTAMLEGLRK